MTLEQVLLSISTILGAGSGLFAVVKAHYVLPMKIEALEKEAVAVEKLRSAALLVIEEKTKTTASDRELLIRLDERIKKLTDEIDRLKTKKGKTHNDTP